MYEASSYASTKRCTSITACRTVAFENHKTVVRVEKQIAIANNKAGGGRALRVCHTLSGCRTLAAEQTHARVWAEATWQHIRHDETPAGAMRVVRYLFAPCGRVAQARAHLIVGWESGWKRYEINGAGDTSWWQIEKGSDSPPGHGWDPHPDVTVAQAEDDWASTLIAKRWSDCGRNWDPTWQSVRDHGRLWP